MAAKRKRKMEIAGPRHGFDGQYEPVDRVAVSNPTYMPWQHGESGNPKTVEATVNRRHDVIVFLYSKGSIDDAQKQAGDHLLGLWEKMGGKGAQAIDYLREHVDGGAAWPDVDVAAMEAAKELNALSIEIGQADYGLLQNIICHNTNIIKIAMANSPGGKVSDFYRKYLGQRFRDALDVAARHWGFAK